MTRATRFAKAGEGKAAVPSIKATKTVEIRWRTAPSRGSTPDDEQLLRESLLFPS
jgi:hypothetical protein